MNRPDPSLVRFLLAASAAALFFGLLLVLRRRYRAQPGGQIAGKRPSVQSAPGWAWLLLALATGSLYTLQAAAQNRLPRGADWLGWIGMGVLFLVLGWLVAGCQFLPGRWGRGKSRRARRPAVSRWALVFWLVVLLAYLTVVVAAKGPRRHRDLLLTGHLILMVSLVVATLGFIWIALRRGFSHEARILAQAQNGDVTGAIAAILELMETRGRTADRLNVLGLCYQTAEQHAEAREVFLEALGLAGDRGDLRNNIAVALLNLGYVEEAEFILSQLCEQDPTQFVYLANYCHVLVKLGRLNDAAKVFHRAEDARAASVPIGKNASQIYDRMLDDCRQLLAAKADLQEGPGREL